MEKRNNATVYDFWRQIVQSYTERRFTNVADVLPALSGLADAFGRATGEKYLAGLWRGDLALNLNWDCRPPVECLEGDPRLDYPSLLSSSEIQEVIEQLKAKQEEVKKKVVKAYRKVGYLAPSWSWASVIHGRVVFSPSNGVHTYVQAWIRTLWQATIIDVRVINSTQNPFGSVSGGHLVIRGPFACIPDPTRKAGDDCSLPTLHKFIHTREMSCGAYTNRFEFDLKHQPVANQIFGLLQTGAYKVISRRMLFPLPDTFPNAYHGEHDQPVIHMLLVESCGDSDADCVTTEHCPRSLERLRWRRLCHFAIPMNRMNYRPDEDAYGAGVRKDLSSDEWVKRTICLV
jgi:hypothetical protein